MRLMVAGFLAGVWWLAHSPTLPDAYLVQALPVCALCVACRARAAPLAAMACGVLWATMHVHARLQDQLPPSLEGRSVLVEGTVAGVPERGRRAVRFLLNVERVVDGGADWQGLVRLSWYGEASTPRSGRRMQVLVRLGRPRGFVNPGGFDYEGWLFARGIAATGYVRSGPVDETPGDAARSLDGTRQALVERMDAALPREPHRGILKAIALGVRHDLTPARWEVLRATGTAHLMAISGLHIGLVSGMAFALVRIACTLTGLWAGSRSSATVAVAAAIAAATGYAALAGFSVPTQRALVMVVVGLSSLWGRRRILPSASVAIALLAVLLLDPMAVVSPGFWLSFVAVAAILYGVVGYEFSAHGCGRGARLWWRWARVHWLIGIALAPLALAYFGRLPVLGPVANLVAVPWVGMTVVPCALLGTLLLAIHPTPGVAVLRLGALSLDALWPVLEAIAGLEAFLDARGPSGGLLLALAGIGTALVLMPRPLPARVAGVAWLLPLLWPPAERPAPGALWLALLDVGQGLAVVVRTRNHALVYDAGPRFSERFDAGAAVVVPYLRRRGIRSVDALVVSHGDNDHSGGVDALVERGLVARLITNWLDPPAPATPCQAERHWRWDGVEFEILHPAPGTRTRGNDGSCVLRIGNAGVRILLPGDIEEAGERALVERLGSAIASSILLLAHHGSNTSSGASFLDAVGPCGVLISRGHRNRFGFPDPRVLARLARRGIPWLDTAVHGGIELRFAGDGTLDALRLARVDGRRIWHRPLSRGSAQRRHWLERVSLDPSCRATLAYRRDTADRRGRARRCLGDADVVC